MFDCSRALADGDADPEPDPDELDELDEPELLQPAGQQRGGCTGSCRE